MRDLSTCIFGEIQARWSDERRAEAEAALGKRWADLVPRDHDPIYFLAEHVWFANPRAKDNPAFLYAPLHRDRYCRAMTRYVLSPTTVEDCDGLLILGPRDTYKSTLAAAAAQWHIMREKHLHNIDVRDAICHHKFTLASRLVRQVAAKFWFHPWMRRYWNEYCPEIDAREFGTKEEFTLPNSGVEAGDKREASLRAIGLTASDTGSHVDLRINDDLVTEAHINSKAVRDEAKSLYEASQFTRDTVTGKEINFGTLYHVNDLWSKMIKANVEGEARYDFVHVKAIRNACATDVGGKPCGHPLDQHAAPAPGAPPEFVPCAATGCPCMKADIFAHPHRLTKAFLEKKMQSELSRTGRIVMWYLQYQCEGRADNLTAAKWEWLRWASVRDIPPDAWPVICVDPAWKGTENQGEGDSAAIQVWYLERRGGIIVRWLVDGAISNEMTSEDGLREIARLMGVWGVEAVAPEMHGGFGFKTALENYCAEKGLSVHVIDLKMKQSGKDQRIVAWLRELEAGHVVACNEMNPELAAALKDQVTDYPQLDHDDAIDAAAYSCDPAIAEAWVPRRPRLSRWQATMRRREPEMQMTRHCNA